MARGTTESGLGLNRRAMVFGGLAALAVVPVSGAVARPRDVVLTLVFAARGINYIGEYGDAIDLPHDAGQVGNVFYNIARQTYWVCVRYEGHLEWWRTYGPRSVWVDLT